MIRRNPATVLMRIRAFKENEALRRLGVARTREEAAAAELVAREQEYVSRPVPDGLLSPVELRALQLQGVRSMELLAEAATTSRRARQLTEDARRVWLKTRDELESVKRLDVRRRNEAARAARRAADRELDRLVVESQGREDPWS
jgi:flagellar biosynthesis chaperone FliJ